ncbi:Hypothetical protein NTJ_16273 [Nesidiocoris tenuis]|uniref:Uncharacterized protein n=1 Tax=Nesidiocoris tenuis TaxID=355587 RepID=A0ABN7BHU7_9HEMI|nr:Hypothetical protein NTJ_16273 [Nesidiocoris tenuis]
MLGRLAALLLIATSAAASCPYPPAREALSNSWTGLSVEKRAKLAPVVFHGLAVETYPPVEKAAPTKGYAYSAQFWLISVYKAARELAALFGTGPPVDGVYDIRDR